MICQRGRDIERVAHDAKDAARRIPGSERLAIGKYAIGIVNLVVAGFRVLACPFVDPRPQQIDFAMAEVGQVELCDTLNPLPGTGDASRRERIDPDWLLGIFAQVLQERPKPCVSGFGIGGDPVDSPPRQGLSAISARILSTIAPTENEPPDRLMCER